MTNWLKRTLNFNQINRDEWVASKAKELPEGSTVLDAGAGSCRYRDLFKHCYYVTQDFCSYEGPSMRYGKIDYVCDITEIPVDDNSFDAILCTEVLEHVTEPIKAIQEFARILKPRGRLFLTAPLGSGIHMPPYHFYGGFSPYWYFLGLIVSLKLPTLPTLPTLGLSRLGSSAEGVSIPVSKPLG